MRPHGSPEELERRRQRALALLDEGLQPVEVAQRLGVDRRSVRRWKAAKLYSYNKQHADLAKSQELMDAVAKIAELFNKAEAAKKK